MGQRSSKTHLDSNGVLGLDATLDVVANLYEFGLLLDGLGGSRVDSLDQVRDLDESTQLVIERLAGER